MPLGTTYGSRESALAEAIVDEMVARGVGVGGGVGGGATGDWATAALQQTEIARLVEIRDRTIDRSLYERVNTAVDMTKAINYADAETVDERIASIIVSSASIGVTFTDTYSYAGSAGNYRVAGIVRSQS